MSKHSPGPWEWNSDYTMLYYRGSEEEKAKLRADGWGPGAGEKLAILVCENNEPDTADAALIAKAPELLAILRQVEQSDNIDNCPICCQKRKGQHLSDCRLAALLKEVDGEEGGRA